MTLLKKYLMPAILAVMSVGALPAAAQQLNEQNITFENNGYVLEGALLRLTSLDPASRHPGIIMTHGSGNGPRDMMRPIAEEYARAGFVVLIYDKRANWARVPITTLAGDVIAGTMALANDPIVDPQRVGVFGVSQAGWVLPIAATRSASIRFGVVITGGGISPRASEIYSWQSELRHNGFDNDVVALAGDLLEIYYDYFASGADGDLEKLMAAIDQHKDEAWYAILALDRKIPDANDFENWQWVASLDIVPHIASSKVPFLALLGGVDTNADAEIAAVGWQRGFDGAGMDKSRVIIFEGASHGLVLGDHDAAMHGAERCYVDGYYETQFQWLHDIGVLGLMREAATGF